MPKQLQRGHAAKTVTLQVPLATLHVRSVDSMLRSAPDTARLRGAIVHTDVMLHARPGHDTVIRRLFSRKEIDVERDAVRVALATAAANLTPERLKRLGLRARLATDALQQASLNAGRHDVKVAQVRDAVAVLAGGGRKRTFKNSPVKSRSSRLVQPGASALPAGAGTRRVLLRRFCADSAVSRDLPALLILPGDKGVAIASSILIFKSVALNCILKEIQGGNRNHKQSMRQLRAAADGVLLRLFISRWAKAKAAGKISPAVLPWFDAVDWLVGGLFDARQPRPGDTRSPRSPRIVSPAAPAKAPAPATPLRIAKPLATPRRTVSSQSALTDRRAAVPRAATVGPGQSRPVFSKPGHTLGARHKTVNARAWARPTLAGAGRQAISHRLPDHLASPSRLAGTPVLPTVAPRGGCDATAQAPVTAPDQTGGAPVSPRAAAQARPAMRTATLLDLALQYQATLDSGNDAAGSTEETASS